MRRGDAVWCAALVLCQWTALALAALFAAHFSYNKWDNFEYYTPTLTAAHALWLQGVVPFWNPHQHLGEPLMANAQPGVFYLPYTAVVAGLDLLKIGRGHFCLAVVATHLPWMGIGVYALLRGLGARPAVAWTGALGTSTAGGLTATATNWIFVAPIFAWLPWALLGCANLLRDVRPRRSLLLAAGSLVAIDLVCHPQYVAYAWLFAALFCGLATAFGLAPPVRLLRLGAVAVPAALLSAPALLPVLEIAPFAQRAPLSERAFLANALEPAALLGLLSPLLAVSRGFFFTHSPLLLHQGGWVAPALLLALALWALRRERTPSALAAAVPAFLLTGLLFALLALGRAGLLYPLTRGIPLWSSFRWPHKFSTFAALALGLAAALGLELLARSGAPARLRAAVALPCLALLALPFASGAVDPGAGPGPLLAALVGALGVVAAVSCDLRWGRAALVAAAALSALAVTTLAHGEHLKTYAEPYASLGPAQLGIDARYRTLPLSMHAHAWDTDAPSAMQEHLLFQMPTANGYDGATGVSTAMVPVWYQEVLASDAFGLLPRERAERMIDSHLLAGLNVRYLAAAKRDRALIEMLRGKPQLRPLRELSRVVLFENPGALPRAWFAETSLPFERERFEAALIGNRRAPRTAFVEGAREERRWPPARVRAAHWPPGGRARFDVDAPEGGLLVVAQTWFPQWRADVDGAELPVLRVNGFVQGVRVPPGARRVELRWHSPALVLGCGLATVGALALALLARRLPSEVHRQGGGLPSRPPRSEVQPSGVHEDRG